MLENGLQRRNVGLRPAARSDARDLRLNHAAKLDRIEHALPRVSDGEAIEASERPAIDRTDAADLSLLNLDHAHGRKFPQGLAGNRLGNAEPRRNPALGGQGITRLQPTIEDRLREPLDDSVSEPTGRDIVAAKNCAPVFRLRLRGMGEGIVTLHGRNMAYRPSPCNIETYQIGGVNCFPELSMIAAAQPDLPSASAGRIVRVTAYPLRARLPITQRTGQGDWSFIEIVVVEVETDQGLIGIGECLARKGACAYARFINLMFAPLLLGQDPLDRRRHWVALRSILSGRAGGMMIEAIAGIDIALWDIAGKACGMPIHKMLGGMGRSEIQAYASSINWFDDAAVEREVAAALAAGFTQIKVKIGAPASAAIDRIRLVRRLAGPDVGLSVDANWAFDVDDAVRVGRALAEDAYMWFEEPIRPEDRQGYRVLRAKLDVRLAAGESDFTAMDAISLVEDRAVGIIQPDVARAGGITETWRIAELAKCFSIAYAPHVGWSGAICVAASLQLAAAAENCVTFECMVFANPLRDGLLEAPVGEADMLVGGKLPIPTLPGLGVALDRAALKSMIHPDA